MEPNCDPKITQLPERPFYGSELLSDLPAKDVVLLKHSVHTVDTASGTFSPEFGEVYFLENGEARVCTESGCRMIEREEVLGLTESIAGMSCRFTLETVTPCRFEVIGRDDLLEILRQSSAGRKRLLRLLGMKLSERIRELADSEDKPQ